MIPYSSGEGGGGGGVPFMYGTVVERVGVECPLCDPGSEVLRKGGS